MKERIRKIIGNSEFTDSTDLFAKGILDSFGIYVFLSELEKEFQIQFANEDLIPQNFSTINAVVQIIGKYRAKKNNPCQRGTSDE